MATLTLTLDEIVPLLEENIPDKRLTQFSAQLDELRAVVDQHVLGKSIKIPVSIRFLRFVSPNLTVKLSIESKWGKNWVNQLLNLFIPENEIQAGITVDGQIVTLNLNELLRIRHIPFVNSRIEPVEGVYHVDFQLDQHLIP